MVANEILLAAPHVHPVGRARGGASRVRKMTPIRLIFYGTLPVLHRLVARVHVVSFKPGDARARRATRVASRGGAHEEHHGLRHVAARASTPLQGRRGAAGRGWGHWKPCKHVYKVGVAREGAFEVLMGCVYTERRVDNTHDAGTRDTLRRPHCGRGHWAAGTYAMPCLVHGSPAPATVVMPAGTSVDKPWVRTVVQSGRVVNSGRV